jgi:hypothetical protein
MPFGPADLEWWQWWLCALGLWVFTWWIITLVRDRSGGAYTNLIGFIGGIAGGICACMGITGLVNWVWDVVRWVF